MSYAYDDDDDSEPHHTKAEYDAHEDDVEKLTIEEVANDALTYFSPSKRAAGEASPDDPSSE